MKNHLPAMLTVSACLALAAPTAIAVTPPAQVADTSATRANAVAAPRAELDTLLQKVTDAGVAGVTAAVDTPTWRWGNSRGKIANSHQNYAKRFATGRAASITKPIVATLIMQQIEAGRWTLDTTIGEIDPTLIPRHPEVTIKQLLNHTSGMPDYFGMPDFTGGLLAGNFDGESFAKITSTAYTHRELLEISHGREWRFEPGTKFDYSNSNYVVLSEILEQALGGPLGLHAHMDVFVPSGMHRSAIPKQPGQRGAHLVDEMLWDGKRYGMENFNPSIFSGAGALVTTSTDLQSFHRTLNAGRLLRNENVNTMRTPSEHAPWYGLGTFKIKDPCSSKDNPTFLWGHDGAAFGGFSLSFAAADGSRSASAIWSSRIFGPNWKEAFDPAMNFYFDALRATCPAPADNESGIQSAANQVTKAEFKADVYRMLSQQPLIAWAEKHHG